MMDTLFSVPRVMKCFFRQDFDLYRRWKRQTDALLILLNEKYTGWQEVNNKKEFGSHEAKLLFERLTAADKSKLGEVFPPSGELTIATSYLNFLRFYVELAGAKADAQRIVIDQGFVEFMLRFAQDEVNRL